MAVRGSRRSPLLLPTPIRALLLLLIGLSPLSLCLPAAAAMPIGGPFGIAASASDDTTPSVAFNPAQRLYMVVWESGGIVTYRMVAEDGTPLGTSGYLSIGGSEAPAVAYSTQADQFLLVWSQYNGAALSNDIYGARLSGDGSNFLGSFIVSVGRGDSELAPALAYNSLRDEFLVVWVDGVWGFPSRWDIYGVRVEGAAGGTNVIGTPFAISTGGFDGGPAVAYSPASDQYLVVWSRDPSGGGGPTDVYGRRISAAGAPAASAVGIDTSSSSQYSPSVAYYGGSPTTPYLVAYRDEWTDWQGRSGVRAYSLDPNGVPVSLVDIAVSTGGQAYEPAVASSDGLGGFTVVWAQNVAGSDADWNVWGRHVIAGNAQAAFYVSVGNVAILGDDERAPALASGSYSALVAWQGNNPTFAPDWNIAGRLVAQALVFTGHVYRGTVGDTSAPLEGVYVSLRGDLDAQPYNGPYALLGEAYTSASGSFTLYASPAYSTYPYYHILESDGPGTLSAGVQATPPGTVFGDNAVIYSVPSISCYTGALFWDQATPPTAVLDVSPGEGLTTTHFQFDASKSSDLEDDPAHLIVRWDWENDGTWDTGWSTEKVATHAYSGLGSHTARVAVQDFSGMTSSATATVVVRYAGLLPQVLQAW